MHIFLWVRCAVFSLHFIKTGLSYFFTAQLLKIYAYINVNLDIDAYIEKFCVRLWHLRVCKILVWSSTGISCLRRISCFLVDIHDENLTLHRDQIRAKFPFGEFCAKNHRFVYITPCYTDSFIKRRDSKIRIK